MSGGGVLRYRYGTRQSMVQVLRYRYLFGHCVGGRGYFRGNALLLLNASSQARCD